MSTTAAKSRSRRTSTSTSRSGAQKGGKSSASKAKRASAKPPATSTKSLNIDGGQRLGPGGLDSLVLGYLKKHKGESPVTAGTVSRGINRSSGAVANCLARLVEAGKARLANKKPRKYDLADKNRK